MLCPIQRSDARHVGDTHGVTQGDTLGDTVSPSCIPQLACKCPSEYRALGDRSATRINPDSPLGLPISPSAPDSIFRRFNVPSQIAIMTFSRMDVVASLGALLRLNVCFVAVHSCGCASGSGER